MTRFIGLTMLALLVLGIGSLFLGSLGAISPADRSNSPYLSALSDASVKPAEAIPCNQLTCVYYDRPGSQHDHWQCDDLQQFGTHCTVTGGGSGCDQLTPCP
jgi:hypothetical protein